MSTPTRKERNAVNAVRDFVDATDSLRSYLEENDKTPLWDGSIFVYDGVPDKNPNLVGTVKTQIKGTEVDSFQDREQYRFPFDDLYLYMREGGLFYFVVELLKNNYNQRRIFYRALTPHTIQALVKQAKQTKRGKESKSLEFTLQPLPTDYRIVEDEMMNFIRDARKQVSFVDKPQLSLEQALKDKYLIKAENCIRPSNATNLALQLTSQPMVMYQETPFANIPIADVELVPTATEYFNQPVSINGKEYFKGFERVYKQKTITDNFGDCFLVTRSKDGYYDKATYAVEIKYPKTGTLQSAIHIVEFLMVLSKSDTITLGDYTTPITFGNLRETLFKDVETNYAIYKDMETMWQQMQIPGVFMLDDFDQKGLNDYLNIVLHVYRKVPGVPINPLAGEKTYYSRISAGPLNVMIRFTYLQDNLYSSDDAFTEPYYNENGVLYPMLTVAMAKSPSVFFDNVHYGEQLECYKHCLKEQRGFETVIQHDIEALRSYQNQEMKPEKWEKIEWLVRELSLL